MMRNKILNLFCLHAFFLIGIVAHATSLIPPYQIGACIACHGANGQSHNPLWPNIGGQHATYLLKQLQEMKTGNTRVAPIMTAVLTALSPTDLHALADYYSNQPLANGKTPSPYLKPGEALYRGGDFNHHISACIACHGPGGEGNELAGFPVVSGLQAQYIVQQLQAFKTGTRKNDLNGIMHDISQRMSDDEMLTVAYYMQGLFPAPVKMES